MNSGTQRAKTKPARINSFDYFRAVSILIIVAGHNYGPWAVGTVPERTLANLISGGTSLFVFISGFFLHSHFYGTTSYAKFLKGKLRTVIAPYVTMITLGFLLRAYILHDQPYATLLVPGPPSALRDLELWWTYLITGRLFVAYWYIPFIAIIFALTPAFYAYIRLSAPVRWALMGAWLVAAMLIQRPDLDLWALHAALCFVPVYMMGINYSIHRTRIDAVIRDKALLLGALTIGLALAQALLTHQFGNMHKPALLAYNGWDISNIQKIVLCLFCMSALGRLETTDLPALKLIAEASFAIFFIHPWLLMAIRISRFDHFYWFLPGIVVWCINALIVTAGSIALAVALKRLLGTKSRYVIGW